MLHTWVTKAARTCDELALLLFLRMHPNDRCVYETAMTGTSWNVCDLKLRNSDLKSLLTYYNTHVGDRRASWTQNELNDCPFISKNTRIFTLCVLINPLETCMALHDFSTALCQSPGGPRCHMVPYESAHCDDHFAGLLHPTLCCSIAMCPFCEQERLRKTWGRTREWLFGTRPICPCPPSHRAIGPDRPDQARSSRTCSADTPGLGWRNAGCSN